MIFQIFQSGLSFEQNLILLGVMLTVILMSVTLHELAHGLFSYAQGDMTAKREGRLTFNPISHLDTVGTICLVFCGFGWAKPVPVDPRQYANPKKGMAITAVAGPLVNFLIGVSATVWLTVYVWIFDSGLYQAIPLLKNTSQFVFDLITTSLYITLYYNLLLAVFNMLPFPPFDGSRIVLAVLPDRYYFGIMKYEKFIMLVVFLLLWSGMFTGVFELFVDIVIKSVGCGVLFLIDIFV